MERMLIVSLLQKNIEELAMITEGFMEMKEYPAVIIQLARRKTEDVLNYIGQLEAIKLSDGIKEDLQPEQQLAVSEETVSYELRATSYESEQQPAVLEDVEEEPEAVEETEPHVEPEVEESEAPQSDDEFVEEELVEAEEGEDEVVVAETIVEETMIESEDEKEVDLEEEVVVDEVVVEEEEIIEEVVVSEIKEEEPTEEPEPVISTPKSEQSRTILVDKSDNTIADIHSHKKIDDIRHAFSIGDRFRFQRELFSGNGELMNKTLSKLNQMSGFDEADSYLHSKFQWNDEDETVESFYQIVKRRYL